MFCECREEKLYALTPPALRLGEDTPVMLCPNQNAYANRIINPLIVKIMEYVIKYDVKVNGEWTRKEKRFVAKNANDLFAKCKVSVGGNEMTVAEWLVGYPVSCYAMEASPETESGVLD